MTTTHKHVKLLMMFLFSSLLYVAVKLLQHAVLTMDEIALLLDDLGGSLAVHSVATAGSLDDRTHRFAHRDEDVLAGPASIGISYLVAYISSCRRPAGADQPGSGPASDSSCWPS